MNTAPLHSTRIPGFRIVSKDRLNAVFNSSQSGFYVLLGRRGASQRSHERILFVDCVDDFLDSCQRQIEDIWKKHRFMITRVAVKLSPLRFAHRDLTQAYNRALAVQELRQKLSPQFRRL